MPHAITVPAASRHTHHPRLRRACGVLASLLCAGALQAADPVGAIFAKPAAGTAYPYMACLPSTYASAATQRFPLVICLCGVGERGDGSSNGTLTEGAANQIAYVLHSGPLALIRGGATYFNAHPAIVASPQTAANWDTAKLDATITALGAAYRVDTDRIYVTGYSLGGGGAWTYGLAHAARLAALAPIAGAAYPGNGYAFGGFKDTPVWAFHDADDATVPTSWTTGTPSGFSAAPALTGWASGIAIGTAGAAPNRCLDSHPDHPSVTVKSDGTLSCLTAVSGTYTGAYSATAGWKWSAGANPVAAARLQVTIYPNGGHGGWDSAYGSGGVPNPVFWDWLLAQRLGAGVVSVPPVAPAPTSTDGLILAKTTAATGAPYAYLVRVPKTYSAAAPATFPLVLCLGSSSENGDGSSDGTLTESTGNQLARVLHAGPLALANDGATYFDDQPAILVQAQTAATWNDNSLDTFISGLVAAYRVDTARIALTGYAQGGGEAWFYGRSHPTRLAALAPICGTTYPSTVARCAPLAGQVVWAFHCSDDGPTPTAWTTGTQTGSTVPMIGWVGGTAASLGASPSGCLDTHPDHPTVKVNTSGTAGCLIGVTATRTGAFAATAGWAWSSGTAPVAGAQLQVTIYAGGGNTGWLQTYGATAATLNRPFWDWLLGQRKAPLGSG